MNGLAPVAAALAREHLSAGRRLRTRAQGHSMWPLLRDGQAVEVLPLPPDGVRVGDVVLLERGERLVLHRIVRRCASGEVITKGDAVGHDDGAIPTGALLGLLARRPWDRATAEVSRRGGRLLARLASRARRVIS